MDVLGFEVLHRLLGGLELPGDAGPALDAHFSRLLDALGALPGMTRAAVLLTDPDGQPVVRARYGEPDMDLVLPAAQERGPDAGRVRVLRRGADPVVAGPDGSCDLPRGEAAALLAPALAKGAVVGWFCADALFGPDTPLALDGRLAVLVADVVAGLASMAGQAAAARREQAQEMAYLRSKVSLRYRHVFCEGQSPAMEIVRAEIDKAAQGDAPVLLLGEAGSGRGILARLVHELSPRAVRPFFRVNAGEAGKAGRRIFGRSRSLGSPGGAGLLEEADGGTLCIEEAHLLSSEIGARLGRYLETGTFVREGGGRERSCRTRLAFKVPPQGSVPGLTPSGAVVVRVPGLRQRREDIPLLLRHFLDVEALRGGRRMTLTSKALKALETYDWPGNIREMEAMVARLALTAPEDRIDIADIPPEMLAEGERPPVLPEDAAELRDMERQQVLNALERHGWVQSRAARELGLTLRQIGYRIRKYGLSRDQDGGDGPAPAMP